jgi:predicted ABC-type sugar transport system permease subunit
VLAGLIRNKFKVPTFIITLASMTALSGFSMIITKGFPVSPFPEWFNFIGGGYLFGVPFPAIVFLLIFLLMLFLIRNTTFGRAVYAVGARGSCPPSGISAPPRPPPWGSPMLPRCPGSYAQTVGNDHRQGLELDDLGGDHRRREPVRRTKHHGTSWACSSGVLINGMTHINQFWQYVVRGGLILGAVLLNQIKTMSARR